jgi:hypothetical protein
MLETISPVKNRKARKQYRCDWCNQIIYKGDIHQHSVLKFDDQIYSWRSHISCSKLIDVIDMFKEYDNGEGITDDDFQTTIEEEFNRICETLTNDVDFLSFINDLEFEEKINFVSLYYLGREFRETNTC